MIVYIVYFPNFSLQFNCCYDFYQLNLEPTIIIISTMSEVDQLIQIVDGILHASDKAQRENAQNTLVQLRTQKPNQLMMAFMMILSGKYKLEHRNFAATQLRLCLSNLSPASYTNLWKTLTPETQSAIKSQLFQILFNEEDFSMKKHIADTLGEVAASALGQDINCWPQFKLHVWELFKSDNNHAILAGFHVLETFLPLCPDVFQHHGSDLFTLFKNGLNNDNSKMKLAALNAFSSFLETLETKQQKPFKSLIEDIFKTVYTLLQKQQEEEGLEILADMLEVDVKFFKSNYNELNQLLQDIFKLPKIEGGVKRMATEILVDFSEKAPTLFRKNKQYIESLLDMLFVHMIDIDSKITDDWKKPAEGYNEGMEDDQDFETTKFGMGAIDRIIFSIGDKEVLPVLSNSIKNLLAHQDWRYQFTALMALSQIGEYIQDPHHISSIIEMINNYFSSENPMLRYASCHAIGQISDDLQPKFQQIYGDVIYPKVVALLQDPIPRVISHAAACLTNFIEGMKFQKMSSNLDQMMELLIHHCINGISIVKESCLSALSSIAEVCKQNFGKYLEVTVSMLFNIIETHTSKEYKQVRGQAIQTMTMIANGVGAEKFRPAMDKLINIMITLQESQFEQTDPQKSYILAGWQRLCLVYGRQLSGYLNRILPSLFALVQNVINNQLKMVNNPEPKEQDTQENEKETDDSINTFETEEAQIAISMLNVFIDELKDLYGPYVQDTATLLCKIINEHSNDDVKQEACKCLPNLVKAVKDSDITSAINMTKYFMQTLVKTIEQDSGSDTAIIEIETLKCVIQQLDQPFLTETQLSQFSEKVLNMLKACQQIKIATHKVLNQDNEGDLDQQDKEAIDDGIKMQEEKQVTISELMGILFKTHKDMSMPLAQYIINNILSNTLKPGLSENMYKFSLFIIDDMIEYLGYQRLQSHWLEFYNVITRFCQQKSCQLRQAACYGLGILAQNTPSDVTNTQTVQQWLNAMIQSSKIPKDTQKQKSYGNCRDNSIAAIGKIIKAHWQHINQAQYLSYWLNFLPLRFDKPEAINQHQFLIQILLTQSQVILGSTSNEQVLNLIRILNIFGVVLNYHKVCNDNIKIKLKQYLLSLRSVSHFAENNDHIWKSVGDKEREALIKLLNTNN